MSLAKKIASVVSVTFLLLSSSVVDTRVASACSCIEPGSPLDALADAQAVFIGSVMGIEESGDVNVATFSVSRFWKGELSQTVKVSTSPYSSVCGYDFKVDQEYLVYAYGEKDDLTTGICSGTAKYDSTVANEDLVVLGEGTIMTEGTEYRERPPIVESLFLTVLFIGLFLYRRRVF